MAFSFRIPHNTISIVISQTCTAIWDVLAPLYLKISNSIEEWNGLAKDFYEKWNVPNMIGNV